MWREDDARKKLDLDEGIETVLHNNKKYIVHPAFMDDTSKVDSEGNALPDYDRGGWDKDLTGIWVSKYEASRTGATATSGGSGYSTTFKSVPGVMSAVTYLTQSQYGRNGHEVAINNGTLTGNGADSTTTADTTITYEYNTIRGAKSSTTGNVYGIYDLSGGKWEHVAVYDKLGARLTYNKDKNKGTIILNDVTDSSGSYISTKYITAYTNGTNDKSSASKLYEIGKVGDATKEVRMTTQSTNWFLDNSVFIFKNAPYLGRGGGSGEGIYNGIFYTDSTYGQSLVGVSFRVSLGK